MPVGLAVDSAGNVYVASAEKNRVYEYTDSTQLTAVDTAAGTFEFSASNAVLPIGMGFDPAGNLYVLDSAAGALIEANSTTNYQLPLSASVTPAGLAVSSVGNLYISDSASDTADEVFYNNNPFSFGSVPAGTNSPAVTVNFYFASRARGLAIYGSMQGDITTEFKTSSTTCSGTRGSTCSMAFYVDYSSAFTGLRNGVVGLSDNAGDLLAVPNIGIDEAAALALYPGIQSTLPQTSQVLYEPEGLAVTGDGGTLFVADEGGVLSGGTFTYTHGAVWAYKATAGTPSGTPTPVGSFPTPTAVALDTAGNLYVADYSGTVTVVPVSNSSTGNTWPGVGTALSLTGAVALNHPMALAFDPSGNLYIGDMGPLGTIASASNPGYIIKVPADGGPATRLNYTVGGVPIVFPQALAADSQGNLYIADGGDGDTDPGGVDVVPVATGTPTAISFGSFAPLSQPAGLSFDAANDLYVLDGYNQRVLVVPITFAGTVPTFGTANISLLGQGLSGLTSALVTPSNLVVWPGGQYITISDIGYQPASGPASPVQVVTLQSVNASVNAGSGSASVTGVDVGNYEATFSTPGKTGTIANGAAFTLAGCGVNGNTLGLSVANTCTSTITYTGTATQSATFTLNGNSIDDYSLLGNQILVTATASVPPSGTTCNGTYTGTFQGNVTVSAGQNCVFVSGGVSGNLTENGGNVVLTQSHVGNDVQINGGGTFTIGPGTTIGNNLQIQSIPSGSGQNQVCGTTVDGNLQFQSNGTAVLIGSTNPFSCAGNTIDGNLEVQSNSAATTVDGNTVKGNLTDQSNTGPTQVFNNAVGNNLACHQNSSITGGGNTAGSKKGQCAAF